MLAESTPGPWHFSEGVEDTPWGTEEIGHEVYAAERSLFGVCGDPVTDEYPGNLPLAALAPELADEVLRMRRELTHMVEDLNSIHDNPNHSDMECLFALFAAMRLRSIIGHDNLGDHDD